MTRRRVASILMFNRIKGFNARHCPPMVAALTGTGTIAADGILTVIVGSGTTAVSTGAVYLTVSSGTNIGTLVGTYQVGGAPI